MVKLFCLTNSKSGNQLWQLGPVQEICIILRDHVSFPSAPFTISVQRKLKFECTEIVQTLRDRSVILMCQCNKKDIGMEYKLSVHCSTSGALNGRHCEH